MSLPIQILAFYKFVSLPDYLDSRQFILDAMNTHSIKGTILLAAEGVNGGIAGLVEDVQAFVKILCALPGFEDLTFKVSYDDVNPFDKAKVKLRKEIVTLGVADIDPSKRTGQYLSPQAWNEAMQENDVLVIDTRNTYEIKMGTFKGAINPNTRNFRDFPAYVEQNLMEHKDKKILMCCTGGIRCEKSTAYLLHLGFKNIYHLEGGILNYLETMPAHESNWEGQCFVFDNRVAVDAQLKKVPNAVSTKWEE